MRPVAWVLVAPAALTIAAALSAHGQATVEVASIKRSVGAVTGPRYVVWLPGERMTATSLTLVELIRSAYMGDGIQITTQIVEGPAWISTDRFDIVGKLANITAAGADGTTRQRETALKQWLADRFKLRLRRSTRELQIGRASCRERV